MTPSTLVLRSSGTPFVAAFELDALRNDRACIDI